MESLKKSLGARQSKNNSEANNREQIREYFVSNYKERVVIKSLENSVLVIKVSNGPLASEINLSKEDIILYLNNHLVEFNLVDIRTVIG